MANPPCNECAKYALGIIAPERDMFCDHGRRVVTDGYGNQIGFARYYAEAARTAPDMCGPDGKWFEEKSA